MFRLSQKKWYKCYLLILKTLILIPMNLFKIITRGEWKAEFHEKSKNNKSYQSHKNNQSYVYFVYPNEGQVPLLWWKYNSYYKNKYPSF